MVKGPSIEMKDPCRTALWNDEKMQTSGKARKATRVSPLPDTRNTVAESRPPAFKWGFAFRLCVGLQEP